MATVIHILKSGNTIENIRTAHIPVEVNGSVAEQRKGDKNKEVESSKSF